MLASTLGNVVGDSIVGAMVPQDPLSDFIDQKLAEQGRRNLYGSATGVPVTGAGLGYRTSGPGIRLSEQAVADWSNDVDSGIGDASQALVNFESAAGRVWGQEDAQAALDGRAALLRQQTSAAAHRRELAAQRAADERLRLDALLAGGGPRGGAGAAYGDVPTGSSRGGSRISSTIDGMPSTAAYQIVANVDERGVPVSYGAYNKVTGQTDYLIGPTGLGEFMSNSKAMTIEAYYRHSAAEARPYERASGQFVMEALNGNFGAAGSAYASSWGEAVQDPHWLASTALTLVGGVVGNAVGAGAQRPIVLDLFGGRTSQIPGAINVDIVAREGVRASATQLPFRAGSVDKVVASNPYLPGGSGIMDWLPGAADTLKPGGTLTINATPLNKFGQLPSADVLDSLGLKVVLPRGPLLPEFRGNIFRYTDGGVIPPGKLDLPFCRRVGINDAANHWTFRRAPLHGE